MHIAEVVTIAKSLPLLRLNTYKSLILSYSADFSVFFEKNTESIEQKSIFSVQCLGISIFFRNFAIDAEEITSRRSI